MKLGFSQKYIEISSKKRRWYCMKDYQLEDELNAMAEQILAKEEREEKIKELDKKLNQVKLLWELTQKGIFKKEEFEEKKKKILKNIL